ncbi:hypothetical protein [Actinomadura sp. 6N118]|uniref:hypothetical protein n=1 Tax=Actinomadura sp. 6N118 TaxID=3375151 RepID=UPI003799907B
MVEEISGGSGLIDFRYMNGEPFIHLGGFNNHRGPNQDVLDLFLASASPTPLSTVLSSTPRPAAGISTSQWRKSVRRWCRRPRGSGSGPTGPVAR